MDVKTCYKCKQSKELTEFSKNSSKKDGVSSQCKMCHKQLRRNHYLKNKEKILSQVSLLKVEHRNWMTSLKINQPCVDCGNKYPHYVMDFDHIDDNKEFSISWAVMNGLSKKRILEEMSKCELVCSNCHRERTHQRQNKLTTTGIVI